MEFSDNISFVRQQLKDTQIKDSSSELNNGVSVPNFVTKMFSGLGLQLPVSSFLSFSLLHPILQNENYTKTGIMTEYNLFRKKTHKIK